MPLGHSLTTADSIQFRVCALRAGEWLVREAPRAGIEGCGRLSLASATALHDSATSCRLSAMVRSTRRRSSRSKAVGMADHSSSSEWLPSVARDSGKLLRYLQDSGPKGPETHCRSVWPLNGLSPGSCRALGTS